MEIHVDLAQNKTKRLEKLAKLWGRWPVCSICGKKLKNNDSVDGHFPFMDEYNRCKKHEDIPIDSDREHEYLIKEVK